MKPEKKKLLNETYDKFMKVSMNKLPGELLDGITAENIMAYGTAIDEKLLSIQDCRDLVERQLEQSSGLKFKHERIPETTIISPEEDSAVIVEEINLTIKSNKDTHRLFLRITTVLEYFDNKWKVVHFHTSKPDNTKGETDTWHIDEWKRKNEELQKLVNEKTTDLLIKNRDLEIEASLERVRTIAMGMQRSEDLLNICEILFGELRKLGFDELRNTMINIHNDKEETFINYDYSDTLGKTITPLFYNINPVIAKQIRQIRKGKDAFSETSFKGNELKEWKKFRKRKGEPDDPRLKNTKALYYYFYSIGTGSIGISTFGSVTKEKLKLLKRFRNVFEFAYRRYMDVTQAEAQANEAKLEASLERVRAQAMGINKSEQLGNISETVFTELKSLGFTDLRNAEIIINSDTKESVISYYYSDYGVTETIEIFYNNHPKVKKWAEEMQKADDAFTSVEFGEDEIVAWRKYREEIGYLPDPKLNKAKAVYYYSYSIGPGALSISTFKQINDEQLKILERFKNVFGLAYRRYADVALAEAQTNEAKIEIALERIRSRTMAMQKSEELSDTAQILFQQFKELGDEPIQITIGIINEEKGLIEFRLTDWRGSGVKIESSHIASIEEPILMKKMYSAWKEQKKSTVIKLSGRKLQKWVKYRSSMSGVKDNKDYTKSSRVLSAAFFSKGLISISSYETISSDTIKLLERFAGVFDLTYTRFLDLKLAEEQTKEARIELALERVRARSMAMHHSSELVDASVVLFEELKSLGIEAIRTGVAIVNSSDHSLEIWSSQLIENQRSKILGVIPFTSHPFFEAYYESWKKKEPYFCNEIAGKEVKKYYKAMSSLLSYPEKKEFNPKEFFYTFFFPEGSLNVVSKNNLSEEECSLMTRFARAFGLIYRRFLDLQKSEAQTREAQIEVALERVRSRTMAMHKSDELSETAAVLFEQLCGLGIDALRLYIGIIEDESGEIDFWTTDYGGSQVSSKYKASLFGSATFRKIYSGWKEKQKSIVVDPKGKELTEHLHYLSAIMNYPIRDQKTLSRRLQTIAYFSKGLIGVLSNEELPKESVILLERFAGVFDLTYRRFLDLQKAESQTKEAQIEVALERVRSRTMAMHSSEELQEAAILLFQQIRELSVDTGSCGYVIWENENKDATVWMSSAEGGIQESFTLPHTKSKIYKEIYSAKESGKDFFVKEVRGKELRNHFDYLTTVPVIGDKIKQLRKARYKFPETIVYNIAFFKQGYLSFHTHDLSPETHDIFKRFANVFEQTYTRFLDLQKAEAQAREAQIQLSLERVRAKAMAMQKSDQLLEVSLELYNQFKQLDSTVRGLTINIVNEKERVFEVSFGMFNQSFKLSIDERIVMSKAYKCWKSGKKSLVLELSRKDLINFNKIRNTAVGSDLFPLEYKSGFKLIMYMAFFSNGMLIVGMEEHRPEETIDILQRFASVFDLTYTRFLDLQKAEAQAREAQIEASLEKIRSRSLAMHNAEELGEVITVVVEKLRDLDFSVADGVALITHIEGSKDLIEWMANPGFPSAIKFYLPYFEHPVLSNLWKAKNEGVEFVAARYTAKENKSFLNHIFKHSDFKHTPQPIKDYCLAADTYATSIAFQKNTAIFINDYSGKTLTQQEIDILKRFSKVFEQAYIRFLDLKKAEAQAREAQIEAALERVRSRTMGMQKSEELMDVIQVIYEQFVHLNINIDHAGIIMDYKERDDMNIWVSDHRGNLSQVTIPYFDTEHWNRFNEAKEKGMDFFAVKLTFKEKNIFYKKLFKFIPELPEEAKEFYFSCPGLAISTVLLDNVSLYIENFSGTPYTDEENSTLMRFGKVFQQTYTRFLDLQKAEAQAREAQIEAALERTRTQSMLMQHSNELDVTSRVFHEQLLLLGIATEISFVWLPDVEKGKHLFWTTWADKENDLACLQSKSVIYDLDRTEPYTAECFRAWESGEPVHIYKVEASSVKSYFDTWGELFSDAKNLKPELFPEGLYYAEAFMKYGCFGFNISRQLTEDEKKILLRFTNEFERTYSRFLDLQKAEAQVREAQIEAALERVRSRAMAMHKTDELLESAELVSKELSALGITIMNVSYAFVDEDEKKASYYSLNPIDGKIMPFPFVFPHTETEVMRSILSSWKKQEPVKLIELNEDTTLKHQIYIGEHIQKLILKNNIGIPFSIDAFLAISPKKAVIYSFNFTKGYLFIIGGERLTSVQEDIILRFTKVFDMTYRRFLDLKQAEAQVREGQIEAALEKVRGKAMAMHNSSDLTDAAGTVFTELSKLGIKPIRSGFVLLSSENRLAKLYPATSFDNKNTVSFTGEFEFKGHPVYEMQYESWQKKENYFPVMEGDLLKSYYKILAEGLSVPYENFPTDKKQFGTFLPFSEGFLFTWSDKIYSENEINILDRFKVILDLTIRRYTDLKTAEAQSRESQIEASLERVRSKAMAMQKSDDLAVAVAAIFEELERLDLGMLRCGIGILSKEHKFVDVWATAISDGEKTLQLSGDESMDSHPLLQGAYEAWLKQEDFSYLLQGEDLISYYKVQAGSNLKVPDSRSVLPGNAEHKQYYHVAVFPSGGLFAFRDSEFPEEAKIVIKRFADVINFTYTRFNDLKQAEAQAKEAKIEAALERVRAGSLIMRKPEDMFDVCKVISEQLILLNVNEIRNTQTVILNEGKETYQNYEYFPDYNEKTFSEIDYNLHPKVTEFVNEIKKSSDAFFTTSFEGKELQEWRDYRKNTNQIPDTKLDAASSVHYYFYSIGPGALGISTYTPLSEDQVSIFKRFRNVFELAYRRYVDIEQAEAQAREAQIEASLERVRSRTLAMQKSDELAETAAVVFKQLINLGIEPNRLYIGIINDDSGDIEAWATDEDGTRVSKEFTLNIFANASVKIMYDGWAAKKKSIIIDMQGKELESYLHYISDDLHVPFKGGLSQNRRVQNIAYFSKGFIGMASPDSQPEETAILLERFAAVFNLTFTRFNDLQIAEKHAEQAELDLIKLQTEKKRAEEALSELRATQNQLIQSEKMASLGELTAGIAHEIQNPLNFVNNFSEVNTELIEELNEEIDKGNFEEAVLIAKDIKENEEKIKHHGKRAEAIVKGMLQHSRSSSGMKEPVSINDLADEYLRLAYHGLRAKDKTFNAKMETDFDVSIGEINVVPQDIGRVILNLITNAFYAVTERKKLQPKDYDPTVTVSTKKLDDKVLISVRDNGSGIPQKVLDKIFQPFFTTKPTGQGTGLGLSMSYDIIKAHGGELKVETKEGEGAEFVISLKG